MATKIDNSKRERERKDRKRKKQVNEISASVAWLGIPAMLIVPYIYAGENMALILILIIQTKINNLTDS
ncbi:hypothetical protein BpHYR1_038916 [Brachionus plicatilis]|uniref:Uncharacterized protein n=1 Tax=Brachionus plicatilis TaxID=10195 RepID=A0A3M7RZZ1_BRAPC|nr:hypothetical protein BpHYR1_038916 [Brachionus plicatilis]